MSKFNLENLTINHQVKCYWGAFDSATERVMKNQDEALKLIQTIHGNAKTCYFPIEDTYDLHTGYPKYETICTSSSRGDVIYSGLLKLGLIKDE